MIFDINFSILLLLCIHTINNTFSIFMIGCFLFSSCFIYLAAMRSLFFTILGEASIAISLYVFFAIDYFSFLTIKDIAINQLFVNNVFIVGLIFLSCFISTILLDGLSIPFDYLECESELVAGIITEFSGFFFILYSLMEINHILLSSLLIIAMLFGGILMTLNSLLVLISVFLVPRAIGSSLNITTAQTYILIFLFLACFIYFWWITLTNIIIILL